MSSIFSVHRDFQLLFIDSSLQSVELDSTKIKRKKVLSFEKKKKKKEKRRRSSWLIYKVKEIILSLCDLWLKSKECLRGIKYYEDLQLNNGKYFTDLWDIVKRCIFLKLFYYFFQKTKYSNFIKMTIEKINITKHSLTI